MSDPTVFKSNSIQEVIHLSITPTLLLLMLRLLLVVLLVVTILPLMMMMMMLMMMMMRMMMMLVSLRLHPAAPPEGGLLGVGDEAADQSEVSPAGHVTRVGQWELTWR